MRQRSQQGYAARSAERQQYQNSNNNIYQPTQTHYMQQQQQQQQYHYSVPQQQPPQPPPPQPSQPSQPQPNTYYANNNNVNNTNMNRGFNNPQNVPSTITASNNNNNNNNISSGNSVALLNDQHQQDNQVQLLSECSRRVQEQSYYMRRAMDNDDLAMTLERAVNILSELGSGHGSHHHASSNNTIANKSQSSSSSSLLTPKSYYELHIKVLDELPHLEEFFLSFATTINKGSGENNTNTLELLYEVVQFTPRLIPRLYLQICVGSAIIRTKVKTSIEMITNLKESVKCVQCPLRGLFLRSYLLQIMRSKLPTQMIYLASDDEKELLGNEYSFRGGGTLQNSIDIVLQNFVEMNQLWVRIQHLPSSNKGNTANNKANAKAIKKKREKERNELRLLIGTNLERLSQLDSVSAKLYKQEILPKILNQITTCNDALAQAYLMDCLIQVFPVEFHIETMEEFLSVCPKLKDKVNARTILQSLMDKLTKHYFSPQQQQQQKTMNSNVPTNTFQLFSECIKQIATNREKKSMNPKNKPNHKEIIHLYTYLSRFSIQCYDDDTSVLNSYISHCFTECANTLNILCANTTMENDQTAIDDLEKLILTSVGDKEKGGFTWKNILQIDGFSLLLNFLPYDTNHKRVAISLVQSIIGKYQQQNDSDVDTGIQNPQELDSLLQIITPLLKDDATTTTPKTSDDANTSTLSFAQEQNLVCKLMHVVNNKEDTDIMFSMLNSLCRVLLGGGSKRMKTTLPCLVNRILSSLLQPIYLLEFVGEKQKEESKVEEEKQEETTTKEEDNKSDADATTKPSSSSTPEDGETSANSDAETNVEGKTYSAEDQVGEEAQEDKSPENVDSPEKEGDENVEEAQSDEKVAKPAPTATPIVFKKNINCRKVFLFLQKIISSLEQTEPELSFKLYLQVASIASSFAFNNYIRCNKSTTNDNNNIRSVEDMNTIAHEFFMQALSVYESDLVSQQNSCNNSSNDVQSLQYRSIVAVVGAISNSCIGLMNGIQNNNNSQKEYERLITKTTQIAAKLSKKQDQCKAIILCSRLFYLTGDKEKFPHSYQNPQRVLECLQRSLKIANACTNASITDIYLFVEILDNYLYHFAKDNPSITARYITSLIALIRENTSSSEESSIASSKRYFNNIVAYVEEMKKKDGIVGEKYAEIGL